MQTQTCRQCGISQTIDNYYLTAAGNPRKVCKACIRKTSNTRYHANSVVEIGKRYERRLMERYGITLAQYRKMYRKQRGRCAICQEKSIALKGQVQRFHVDHDHKTGKVRGLLCYSCNTGLGAFKDDPKRLERARDYIAQHAQPA